jgi:hypothetical protein
MSTPVTNFLLSNICKQRERRGIFNIALPRIENSVLQSPYSEGFTKEQLDMRRKAEVLKYNNNVGSTKTNNLTKSEKWSQIVKGNSNYQTSNYPSINLSIIDYLGNFNSIIVKYPDLLDKIPTTQYIRDSNRKLIKNTNAYQIVGTNGYYIINIILNGQIKNCIDNLLIPTPTSSSNVPGPIINLIDDESVPLYNYKTNVNSYSYDSINNKNNRWLLNQTQDIFMSNEEPKKIFSLFITDAIDKSSYNFSLDIPISIYISGTNLSTNFTSYPLQISNLDITMIGMSFNVKYNETPISFITPPTINLVSSNTSLNTLPLINQIYLFNNNSLSNSFSPISFDISFSTSDINIDKSNINYYDIDNNITTNLSSADTYVVKHYIGYLNISNIVLLTTPGFIYDFYLNFNMSAINFSDPGLGKEIYYKSNIGKTYGPYIIANVSDTNDLSINSILHTSNIIPPKINGMSFSGY